MKSSLRTFFVVLLCASITYPIGYMLLARDEGYSTQRSSNYTISQSDITEDPPIITKAAGNLINPLMVRGSSNLTADPLPTFRLNMAGCMREKSVSGTQMLYVPDRKILWCPVYKAATRAIRVFLFQTDKTLKAVSGNKTFSCIS